MLSVPEIAVQIVDKSLREKADDCSRTIVLVGSKSVGKSTLLHSFLEKNDTPRETLILEYSFGRKSNQKQLGIEKIICHVWEYGGKLEILKNVLSSVPIRGNFFFCVMVDLSKIKHLWDTIENSFKAMTDVYSTIGKLPELIIICGKYDLFKNYDSEIKKLVCSTMRSLALLYNAHLLFYSSKEPQLVRRAKELFHSMGFGNGVSLKEKHTNFNKSLNIPKGTDSWESIGVAASTLEQIKVRYVTRISPAATTALIEDAAKAAPYRAHPEPSLDSLIALKFNELRSLESLDISTNDYLNNLQ